MSSWLHFIKMSESAVVEWLASGISKPGVPGSIPSRSTTVYGGYTPLDCVRIAVSYAFQVCNSPLFVELCTHFWFIESLNFIPMSLVERFWGNRNCQRLFPPFVQYGWKPKVCTAASSRYEVLQPWRHETRIQIKVLAMVRTTLQRSFWFWVWASAILSLDRRRVAKMLLKV